jgi:hypothetical protein
MSKKVWWCSYKAWYCEEIVRVEVVVVDLGGEEVVVVVFFAIPECRFFQPEA